MRRIGGAGWAARTALEWRSQLVAITRAMQEAPADFACIRPGHSCPRLGAKLLTRRFRYRRRKSILRSAVEAGECDHQPCGRKRIVTKLEAWRSGRRRSRTNQEGNGNAVSAVDCGRTQHGDRQSLPTPLPGDASGCNVKPNAQTAATEVAADSFAVIPLAGVRDPAGPPFSAVHKQ